MLCVSFVCTISCHEHNVKYTYTVKKYYLKQIFIIKMSAQEIPGVSACTDLVRYLIITY